MESNFYYDTLNAIFLYTELYSLGLAKFKVKYPSITKSNLDDFRNKARMQLMWLSPPSMGAVEKIPPSYQSAISKWASLCWGAQNGKDFTWADFMKDSTGKIINKSDLEAWFPGFKYDSLGQIAKKAA